MTGRGRSRTTARDAASRRAARVRVVHREVAAERRDLPDGLVLAVALGCARDLHRAGCDEVRFDAGLSRLVRAVLLARGVGRDSAGGLGAAPC